MSLRQIAAGILRLFHDGPGRDYAPEAVVRRMKEHLPGDERPSSGHMHIYVDGFSDHLVLFWQDGCFQRLAAKSLSHGRGRYAPLRESEFRRFPPAQVLSRLRDRLGKVGVCGPRGRRTWPSYADFLAWLAGGA